jgi:hypothetical protein
MNQLVIEIEKLTYDGFLPCIYAIFNSRNHDSATEI